MDLETMLAETLKQMVAKDEGSDTSAPASVSKADLDAFKTEIAGMVQAALEPVAKAFADLAREGVGRKGLVAPQADEFETDPVAFLAKKGLPETTEEKAVALAVFKAALGHGMRD